jgi:hypothetical protein
MPILIILGWGLGRGDQRLTALAASRGALPASFSDQS